MGEKQPGRVINLRLGGSNCASSHRMLSHMLDKTDGVMAYFIDPETHTLTAYLDDEDVDDVALVRALMTAGMYPRISDETGSADEGGTHAC